MGALLMSNEVMKDLVPELCTQIEDRILSVLNVYPGISLSMLHYAMNAPANVWRPVFERLLRGGQIVKITVRQNVCTCDKVWGKSGRKLYSKYFRQEDVRQYETYITQIHALAVIS